MQRLTVFGAAVSVLIVGIHQQIIAAETLLYKEFNLTSTYDVKQPALGDALHIVPSVGMELFQKLSNEYGDFLTRNIQARFTYDINEPPADAWRIEIHNAWLEFTLGLGKKLRIGHFKPFVGLESVEDTHGTLVQTLAKQSIGFKHDWGVGYRGLFGPFDYHVAAGLGNGMSIHPYRGTYLVSGRLSYQINSTIQCGLSGMYGNVIQSMGMATVPAPKIIATVMKSRGGYDVRFNNGAWTVKNESVIGKNDETWVGGMLVQGEYVPPDYQNIKAIVQSSIWSDDIYNRNKSSMALTAGIDYTPMQYVTFRTLWTSRYQPFDEYKDMAVAMQLYYFGL